MKTAVLIHNRKYLAPSRNHIDLFDSDRRTFGKHYFEAKRGAIYDVKVVPATQTLWFFQKFTPQTCWNFSGEASPII